MKPKPQTRMTVQLVRDWRNSAAGEVINMPEIKASTLISKGSAKVPSQVQAPVAQPETERAVSTEMPREDGKQRRRRGRPPRVESSDTAETR